ncbi:MAG: ABC transporter permease [Actinomycetota bacterium]|nr:ABC transporter permease [Actinomycetota bacterium]
MTGTAASLPVGFLGSFGDAIEFIFQGRESPLARGEVGGLGEVWDLLVTHIALSSAAMALGLLIALPLGIYLGHQGRGELFAVAAGNAGRALPELVLIALFVAFIGTGFLNVTLALMILAIPPILTNTFVGIRQVDRTAVEAARGMGMSERAIALRIELPLAAPTIMTGVRTSAINVIATATIAPLGSVLTLGDFILSPNVYGDAGVIAGAIVVAVLALTVELLLAGLQKVLTPKGLSLQRATG